MNKIIKYIVCVFLGLMIVAGCSKTSEINESCIDSLAQEYLLEEIDRNHQFVFSKYNNDISIIDNTGNNVAVTVNEENDKFNVFLTEGEYKENISYKLTLNTSQLDDELLRDAKVIYFSVNKIEDKQWKVKDIIINQPIVFDEQGASIGEVKALLYNDGLGFEKEIVVGSFAMQINGNSAIYENGILQISDVEEGTHQAVFAFVYDNEKYKFQKEIEFKENNILNRFDKDELLQMAKEKFETDKGDLVGLSHGALFETEKTNTIMVNGYEFGLAKDPKIRTKEGFEEFYYSYYSHKYPMINMRMHIENGKVYFPVVSGIGFGATSKEEINKILKSNADEVWFNIEITDVLGNVSNDYFSLVYENGEWKYGTSDYYPLIYKDYSLGN